MASKSISFSVALVATAIVLFTTATTVSGHQAKNPCEAADDKPLCIAMIHGAKTWRDAMTNALQATLKKADVAKNVVDAIPKELPNSLEPQTKESIEETCKEAYASIIDNSKESMGFVKSGDINSLRTYLSSIGYSDCVDGLNEFGESLPDISRFSTEMRKFGSTLLAIAATKKN